MKNFILTVSLCLTFVSCKTPDECDRYTPILVKNFVVNYVNPEKLEASFWQSDAVPGLYPAETRLRVEPDQYEEYEYYITPDLVPDMNPEKFLEIAARNNDVSYNKMRYWFMPGSPQQGPRAFVDNFSGIEVVCTNAAWDASHPAGTSLKDLVRLRFTSFYDFVHSGYADENAVSRKGTRLSELSPTDLYMLGPLLDLLFDSTPSSPGSYEMLVTLTTVDGAEKTATCTIDF